MELNWQKQKTPALVQCRICSEAVGPNTLIAGLYKFRGPYVVKISYLNCTLYILLVQN
jgi:hypothetical protein